MTGSRDGHKNRVYAAEAAVFPFESDLADHKAVQAYADKVVRSAKFKALWIEHHASEYTDPPSKIVVKMTRGHGARVYRNRTVLYRAPGRGALRHVPFIEIGERGMCTNLVLHEIAHLIACHDDGHGREFARVLLLLVRRFRPEDAPALLEQYKLRRIRYSKPATTAPAAQRAAS